MLEALSLTAKIVNTLILFLIAYGLWVRHKPHIHMKVMITCFIVDVVNVAVVEIVARLRHDDGAGAVEQGLSSFLENAFSLLNFHILVSVICIVCYVIAVITGRKLHRTGEGRRGHKVNAIVFIVTRLLSWGTSFYV